MPNAECLTLNANPDKMKRRGISSIYFDEFKLKFNLEPLDATNFQMHIGELRFTIEATIAKASVAEGFTIANCVCRLTTDDSRLPIAASRFPLITSSHPTLSTFCLQ
jgi:hypothetical protein